MKNAINLSIRQVIANVNNAHSIYTKDEVSTILWGLQATIESMPEPEVQKQTETSFSKEQVEEMLLRFGKQLKNDMIEFIEQMEVEIDTDEIEIDDYDDFDIQISSGHRIELEYEGTFRYNGPSPSILVSRELDQPYVLDEDSLRDDITLFMNNELSKIENEMLESPMYKENN